MNTTRAFTFVFGLMWLACPGSRSPAFAEELFGRIGHSTTFGSSWMDLGALRDFSTGDTFRITLQDGNARCVLVRLLCCGESPDDEVGIVGGPRPVNPDRTVVVILMTGRKMIKQISVHGKEPWGRAMCPNIGPASNGAARIQSIDYTPAGRSQ